MLAKLRGSLQDRVTHPIGRVLGKTGITPNTFTLLSLPIALVAGYCIFLKDWPLALLFVLISLAWDNLDGAIARTTNQVSTFGSYLDYMVDKHVELIFYTAFAYAGYPLVSIIAASFNMLNSVAKPATAIRIPLGNADWPAIGERADRMILMMAGMLVAIFYPVISGYDVISATLWLVVLINIIGTYQRMLFAKKLIAKYEKTGKKQMVRK